MRGINISQSHKRAPYFGYHRQAEFNKVRRDWGLNGVRLLVSWAAIEPQKGKIDASYLDAMAKRVAWAQNAGLLVVVDAHQDVYGEGFGGNGAPRWTCDEKLYDAHVGRSPWFLNYSSPQVMQCFDRLYTSAELRRHFAEAWGALAKRLVRYSNIVGFDILNEPSWGSYKVHTFEKDRLQPFYRQVIAEVRRHAPNWLAFAEPANSRNLGIPTSLQRWKIRDMVYAPHSYDAEAEQGKGFAPARAQQLIDNVAALAKEAERLGCALWIGEYGAQADKPGVTAYLDAQYAAAGAVAASAMYWEYSKGRGYSPVSSDGTEVKELVSALVRPYPRRVAGEPLSYRYDSDRRKLTVRYRPDRSVSAPTLIELPGRIYTGGVSVRCGGCSWARLGSTLAIRKVPDGDTALVEITPKP